MNKPVWVPQAKIREVDLTNHAPLPRIDIVIIPMEEEREFRLYVSLQEVVDTLKIKIHSQAYNVLQEILIESIHGKVWIATSSKIDKIQWDSRKFYDKPLLSEYLEGIQKSEEIRVYPICELGIPGEKK